MPFVVLNPKNSGPSGLEERLAIVCSRAFLPVLNCTFGIYFSSIEARRLPWMRLLCRRTHSMSNNTKEQNSQRTKYPEWPRSYPLRIFSDQNSSLQLKHFIEFVSRLWVSICRLLPLLPWNHFFSVTCWCGAWFYSPFPRVTTRRARPAHSV